MLQNTHFPQENDQCRMGPDKPGEMEGILALPSRDREFSAYFQLLWDWGSKETPGRKQPPLPIHSWSKLNLSGMRGHKRNKNKTGLQGAEITTHASPGTWTFQIAQKGIFFFFKAAFKFNAILWLLLTNHSKLSKLMSLLKHSLPAWECCGRKFEWTRESNLQELRNWHSFSPS